MLEAITRKVTKVIKKLETNRGQVVFIVSAVIIYLAYFSSRVLHDPDIVVGWFGGIYLGYVLIKSSKVSEMFGNHLKKCFILASILLLIYSFFYYRTESWDGGALYNRNAFLVKEKLASGILQGALYPYLSEFLLGLLARVLSDNFMFLAFGLASIGNLYTAYLIYKRLNFSSFVARAGLLVLATSPTYIMLSLHEFKVELFLLLLCNLYFLVIIKCLDKPTFRNFGLLGFLGALSFLTKVSVLPLIFFCPVLFFIYLLFHKKTSLNRGVGYLSVYFFSFLLSILVWLLYSPAKLPVIGDVSLLSRHNLSSFEDLERDPWILNECMISKTKRDLSAFAYYENELWLLIQPIQYIFLVGLDPNKFVFNTGNPGPYIYFGIWFLPLVSYLFFKNNDLKKLLVFTVTIPFILVIYLMGKTVFWYFFPVFPLLSVVIPFLAEKYVKDKPVMDVFKIMLISFVFLHGLWGVGVASSLFKLSSSIEESNPELWSLSKAVQNLPGTAYVMDASQHLYVVFLPFVSNYDTRVVRSDYYFASSGKNTDEMRQELLAKNIGYIVVRKNTLFSGWYAGCPLRNNEILFQFLERHTKMVYDSVYVGEIYKII